MVSTTSTFIDFNEPNLTLILPNGNEIWEVGKTVSITWQSFNLSTNITIEYSNNNGNTWNSVTSLNPEIKKFDWQIPNSVSNQCLVRVSSGSKNDMSEHNFSIIEYNNLIYKIIILGSSTAAGTGPIEINDAWAWKYKDYLTHLDTRFEVINLAQGGFTTYNLLPTGTTIPSSVSHAIDINRNINKAISLNANGIIINLPSNDANFHYPSIDQIANYHLIKDIASMSNIPVWISSPQPKNFRNNTNGLAIQLEMLTTTPIEFNEFSFDFWTDLGNLDNNGIKTEYNSDGTHMNATGHRVLFNRVIDKNIHSIVKSNVDYALSINNPIISSNAINFYPNPFKKKFTIDFENNNNMPPSKTTIIDALGKVHFSLDVNINNYTTNKITISPFKNKNQIKKGVYYCKIDSNDKSIIKKIVLY